ncbi:MAG: BlaI/MecI/CopY family transcriptional regulator [Taibaiella sp.]|nr:BlaI/MecI/CopY family transcriptional regulator [Taibaiella sp.]
MKANYKPLTKAEEDIMQVLWRLEKAFVKEIVDEMPEPKPHYNTVSTIIKILADKGIVGFESLGKANRYHPLVRKDDYSRKTMKQFVKRYFEGSYSEMFSFFVKDKDVSVQELENILKELKNNNTKK